MKVFITGGSGLLGQRLSAVSNDDYELILSHNSNPTTNTVKCDITNIDEVRKVVFKIKPDVIIHTAAMTNVDLCEEKVYEAYKINKDGSANIAKVADEVNSKIIYVSTDFVFDGKKGNYKETDEVNPLGIYAKSKYEGEVEVIRNSSNWAIARVSVLYGWHPRQNFTTWAISELRNNNPINIVTDQINSPTLADNASEAIYEIANQDKNGIYHTSGCEAINRYDFTLKIAEAFNLDKNLVNPTTSAEFKQVAPRPANSSLDTSKVKKELGIQMETCSESLERMAETEKSL